MAQKTPLFSIVIPTFNRADRVVRAIKSVQEQLFDDWELIVVDDGSTDATGASVQPFLSDERIRYHWQKNRELNGARNAGIALARGKYLSFLDDDDWFLPPHLATLAQYLKAEAYPTIALRTGMWMEAKDGRQADALLDEQAATKVQNLWKAPTNLLSFAFHRTIFERHLFAEEYILAEDLHFLLRVFLDFPFVQLPDYTVVYELQEDSRTNTYFREEHLQNKLAALQAIWACQQQHPDGGLPDDLLRDKLTETRLQFAKRAFRQGNNGLGWRYYWQAIGSFSPALTRSYLRTLFLGVLRY